MSINFLRQMAMSTTWICLSPHTNWSFQCHITRSGCREKTIQITYFYLIFNGAELAVASNMGLEMPMAVLKAMYFEKIKVLLHTIDSKFLIDLTKKFVEFFPQIVNLSKLWAHRMVTQALANKAGISAHRVSQMEIILVFPENRIIIPFARVDYIGCSTSLEWLR